MGNRNDAHETGSGRPPDGRPRSPTKTRLRRGEVPRDRTEHRDSAEIIDFLPAVHEDIEDILCNPAVEPRVDDDE